MSNSSEAITTAEQCCPKMASALRESERRFQATFEQAAVGMARRDAAGRFIQVNRTFCEFTGYESQELLAMTFREITHPDDLEKHTHLAQRLVAGEIDHYTIEQRYVRKDGAIVWGRVTVSAVRDDDGNIGFYSVVVQDVSEQHLLRSRLDQEHRFVQSIIDTAPVIILVLDAQGRIVLFNEFFHKLSGYHLEEVKGRNWIETFIPPDEQDRIRGVLSNSLSGIRTRGNINAICTRDGREPIIRWFDAELSDEKHHPNAIVAVGEDITEQLHTEECLRAADHLATIGNLAAGLGHDMGNIVLSMRLALTAVERGGAQQGGEAMETIHSGVTWLQNLCANLRRLVRSRSAGERETVDLAAWWKKIQSLLGTAMPVGVSLRGEFPARLSAIRVNEAMLMRAMLNLVVNAGEAIVETGRNDGQVTIWARIDEDDPRFVLLGVRDNGPGIDPAVRERIFEPFFSNKQRGLSTGMGLAMVQSFVKEMGGSITVESEVGAGTNMVLRLPVPHPAPASG